MLLTYSIVPPYRANIKTVRKWVWNTAKESKLCTKCSRQRQEELYSVNMLNRDCSSSFCLLWFSRPFVDSNQQPLSDKPRLADLHKFVHEIWLKWTWYYWLSTKTGLTTENVNFLQFYMFTALDHFDGNILHVNATSCFSIQNTHYGALLPPAVRCWTVYAGYVMYILPFTSLPPCTVKCYITCQVKSLIFFVNYEFFSLQLLYFFKWQIYHKLLNFNPMP